MFWIPYSNTVDAHMESLDYAVQQKWIGKNSSDYKLAVANIYLSAYGKGDIASDSYLFIRENTDPSIFIFATAIKAMEKSGNFSKSEISSLEDSYKQMEKEISNLELEGGACFTGDTLILTKDGYKHIKNIKVDNEVYSENTDTGEKGLKKVENVYIHETDTLIHITVGDTKINTTPTHPFWVVGSGWLRAGKLCIGDKLLLSSGKIMEIGDISKESLKQPIKVYNFEVEDWHTYFVSNVNVLVHNSCSQGGSNAPKEIYTSIKKAPNYPEGFTPRQNGLKKVNINDPENAEFLRQAESGQWKKVYKDGYDANGRKISIHYFESLSGKVFNVKVKSGWSN